MGREGRESAYLPMLHNLNSLAPATYSNNRKVMSLTSQASPAVEMARRAAQPKGVRVMSERRYVWQMTAAEAAEWSARRREKRLPPSGSGYVGLTGKNVRKACWERDRGVCARCGYASEYESNLCRATYEMWFADHVTPIWSVDKTLADAARYWTIENLQTLCWRCHKKKTASETSARRGLA